MSYSTYACEILTLLYLSKSVIYNEVSCLAKVVKEMFNFPTAFYASGGRSPNDWYGCQNPQPSTSTSVMNLLCSGEMADRALSLELAKGTHLIKVIFLRFVSWLSLWWHYFLPRFFRREMSRIISRNEPYWIRRMSWHYSREYCYNYVLVFYVACWK